MPWACSGALLSLASQKDSHNSPCYSPPWGLFGLWAEADLAGLATTLPQQQEGREPENGLHWKGPLKVM